MSQTACRAPPWGQGLGSSNTFLQRECVHFCLLDLKQGRCFVLQRFSSHNIASPYTCPVPDPWIPWPVGLVQVRYAPHHLVLGSLALQALWSSWLVPTTYITSCIVRIYPLKTVLRCPVLDWLPGAFPVFSKIQAQRWRSLEDIQKNWPGPTLKEQYSSAFRAIHAFV